EQEVEQKRLEAEIRSNLIREQGEKIRQQSGQIDNYQRLLRISEDNLKKCQGIIQQKEQQLEELEKEKDLIGEELSLANSKIQELESTLLAANGKMGRLEARIRELESKGDNSEELERLKKELAAEKQKSQSERSKSQSEINRLKQELQQTKLREEQLAQKIKELGAKTVKIQEVVEKSFWESVKTPLFYGVGVIIVVIGLVWVISWFTSSPTKSDKKAEETRRWLTDKEIDWATAKMEKKQSNAGLFSGKEEELFTYLLSELTDATAELVFIPVNQSNFHWSLLVYETKTKTFYHYDTLGGAN
ncbi:14619_t:CDS:2, partial [Racocetra persica]